MIIGIGIDIIELERMSNLTEQQQEKLVHRILTEEERVIWGSLSRKRQIEFIAGRFAAKEALSKALGTGIGAQFSLQDVSILSQSSGAPVLHWHDNRHADHIFHLSISHSEHYAVAQVIIEQQNI
ncbi:holo-ACP synthase [Bacillus horti]|uniref:Holo-[acyl-carrier-protein] synthase n=1 Tax=Caldalkalibacillus horti TaxID=77523 RepID=A0ABT9W4S7_9BACI|nr:holo-ACP synthase [Bacillus horti]MDQ0168249.1 holo-[acyl-carrier protein] synthase [Bacillus horti]